MIHLNKNHDPHKNEELISSFFPSHITVREVVEETNALFAECKNVYKPPSVRKQQPFFSLRGLREKAARFLIGLVLPAKQARSAVSCQTIADETGFVYPEWKRILDKEYEALKKKTSRTVNVTDYGAVGDGVTDCTEAFRQAIGKGEVTVHVPEGVFIVKGIKLPSCTRLVGAGKDRTTLKLHDKSPKSSWLVTNAEHKKGNHHLLVEGMTLDWNVERLGDVPRTSTGGNRSSCLTYAHVTYGWVKDVRAVNPGLHGFDVSSTKYSYSGDGYRAKGGSKYVWLDGLSGYGFGDDGITTHHSDYIFISRSHMCDPSGKAHNEGISNSNGIEVDDGSRNVWLFNNSTARCFGGVEIKAHHNSSAASNVHIVGHLSVNDNRSFNFRHIGHHHASDEESLTAYNITASRIVSIAPIRTALYRNSRPRSLVVSAYKNVVINHFAAVGDPAYDYKEQPVIAIQYRARNVHLNRVHLKGFRTAGVDIKVFGGEQRADDVHIRNVVIERSARKGIFVGAGIQKVSVRCVKAIGQQADCGCEANTPMAVLEHIEAEGYKIPILSDKRTI
ncbi:glycosyl hydrolase family 28-related protein [Bacillus thermotolerans]|uniref:Phage neck n=1 Tax=Bacillus thermotolerans TaxID=1221996 RepID=A0A0F5HIF8_BACTR|nr:glycosyl hydrolase family 28-related protein [Bacillus thermotolerans]KKB33179.1 Phage neck [Bacillus thermotolerans]KKB38795.1 Phage neck [Bacillus thermotolerans]